MSEEKETSWYSHLRPGEFDDKHVCATLADGTVLEGRLVYDQSDESVRLGSTQLSIPWDDGSTSIVPCPEVLWCSEDGQWHPLKGIESLDLVWDERDWERIDARNLRCGDAVVVDGVLYEVTKASLVHTDYPCVGTDALGRNPIDLRLVSCALRRRVQVPAKPGYYKDMLGEFWSRAAKSTDDGPWRSVEPDALDQSAKSDKYMANLMPLTPVHFVDGGAPEPGDELASVMRVTSKGVTFTTEAA